MSLPMDYQAHPYGVQFHGPFVETHRVTVENYRVPYIEAFPENNGWLLVVDERFGISATDEEARKWLPFVAHAMAVAAGFSCHGEGSGQVNPFANRLLGVTLNPEEAQP